jgi:DNA-binding PadR family transcriptional regulator
MPANRDPAQLLPLTPAVLHILLALSAGERHGYSIMQDIRQRTDGKFQLGSGSLYGSIKRMLASGLVRESDERPDPAVDDQRRRYYGLTPFGRHVLEAEMQRLEQLVRTAKSRNLLGRPEPV